jgi:hypothetical protein
VVTVYVAAVPVLGDVNDLPAGSFMGRHRNIGGTLDG